MLDLEDQTEAIVKNFENILNEQSLKAHHQGGAFGVACYREAQYLMAALADEIFLNLSWDGQKYWESHLLEERLFRSHVSGEKFFVNLDILLKERNPLKQELGILYLTCLGLGFQGKYRGGENQAIFSNYRQQLFTLIYHQKPGLFEGRKSLCPQALLYTLEGALNYKGYDNRNWLYGFLGILIGYLCISYGVWFTNTHTLSQVTKTILHSLKTLEN